MKVEPTQNKIFHGLAPLTTRRRLLTGLSIEDLQCTHMLAAQRSTGTTRPGGLLLGVAAAAADLCHWLPGPLKVSSFINDLLVSYV